MAGFFKFKFVASYCLILFILLFSVLTFASAAVCDDTNTPKFSLPSLLVLSEDELFEFDINVTNIPESGVIYSFSLLESRITGLKISPDGVLSLMPGREDSGSSTIAIVAVNSGCVGAGLLNLMILSKPVITSYSPLAEAIGLNQTATVNFSIRAELDDDPAGKIEIKWYLDSEPVAGSDGKESFWFTPGYNLSGAHNISVIVTGPYNLSVTKSWLLEISRVNRAPVLAIKIPDYLLVNNTASGAYNLNDYFIDPDKGRLLFSYRQVFSEHHPFLSQAEINVTLSSDGYVTYSPKTDARGVAYFMFTAQDLFGLSAESNNVKVDLISQFDLGKLPANGSYEEYCGNLICGLNENCTTCTYDCGPCEDSKESGCSPVWNCTEWSVCYPQGYQVRSCSDVAECGDNRTKPSEAKRCKYEASCDDGLKNGIEEGVDCGGPCDACPTCFDGLQNQGENGVDCGGPCAPCPSCTDGMKNQNETDIDCGGTCPGCAGDKACRHNRDCESFKCSKEVCMFASCEDSIKNQGEEGIDCGGPCPKMCGNCSDGVQNQGETGVDCGGKCRPCPSCTDGIKNGDEDLVDCGGECRKCTFNDFLAANMVWIIIIGVIVTVTVVLMLSYFVFILANPENAKRLYSNNSFFLLMTNLNHFCRSCRKIIGRKPLLNSEALNDYKQELLEMSRHEFSNRELYDTIIRMYGQIFNLPAGFDESMFFTKIKESKISPFLKVLIVGFYKKADILVVGMFVPDEERESFLTEFRFLITELGKA